MSAKCPGQDWYLEGSVDGTALPTRFGLKSFPARIGRDSEVEILLPVPQVSSLHAEIFERDDRLWVQDRGSSNGTRLNQVRLEGPSPLNDGDILHFANLEFIFEQAMPAAPQDMDTCMLSAGSNQLVHGARSRTMALRQMIDQAQVVSAFQPIVNFHDPAYVAFELLGRGARDDLPISPGPLFQIAESSALAADLSALFRRVGIDAAMALAGSPRIFTNAHPHEVGQPALLRSLEQLRERYPAISIALEVHETTVTDPRSMRELRAALAALDILIAFDDFGAGQARLLELAESPPDYLKFDMSLIRDIHQAPPSRQSMVGNLVNIVKGMGVRCLAEGIECNEELETCMQMGFEYGQGYLLGRPQAVDAWPLEHAQEAQRSSSGSSW